MADNPIPTTDEVVQAAVRGGLDENRVRAWLAWEAAKNERDALQSAAVDLGDTGLDTFWEAVNFMEKRAGGISA